MAKRPHGRARSKSFAEIVDDVESDDSIVVRRQFREPARDSPWFVNRWTDAAGTKWKVRRNVSAPYIIRLLEDPNVPARECAFFTGEIRTLKQLERVQVIERLLDVQETDVDDLDECDWPPAFMVVELRSDDQRSEVLVSLLDDWTAEHPSSNWSSQ